MQVFTQKPQQLGWVVGADRIANLLDDSVVASFRPKIEPQRTKSKDDLRRLSTATGARLLSHASGISVRRCRRKLRQQVGCEIGALRFERRLCCFVWLLLTATGRR